MSDHTIVVIWVIKTFLFNSSVYSCHLFLIYSASVRSLPFLSFIVPIFVKNLPLASPIFLNWSLAFFILLFSSISVPCSYKKAFLSLLAIHLNFAFPFLLCLSLLFSQQSVRPPQTTIVPSCISFSLRWFCSPPPVKCYEPSSTVLYALYQIYALSDLRSWIYLPLSLS